MLTMIQEGIRIGSLSIFKKIFGHKHYSGDAKEICTEIINDCWKGEYFAGGGHFRQFWTRDFGFMTPYLLKLGLNDKVIKTLSYANRIFNKYGVVTTTFKENIIKVYDYSIDSFALFVRSAKLANYKLKKEFIEKEVKTIFKRAIGSNGLVRKGYFSSFKDYYKRNSSTYDNIMIAMLAEDLKDFKTELDSYDFKKIIKKNLWNGQYFYDDLDREKYVAGDANVIPFWTGIFNSKDMIKSSMKAIRSEKLDQPFPLKFTNFRNKKKEIGLGRALVPNYQGDTIWSLWGILYIDVVSRVDPELARTYLSKYEELTNKHKTFLEVYNREGKPYRSLVYSSCDSMLWAAGLLYWLKQLN